MKIIDLPPNAPTLIESTRAIGYTLEAAIADIIDNSIAANANEINISFLSIDNPYISILDNGRGMMGDELTIAMQYGSQNPLDIRNTTDLGRFGLGLKTASLSQCRKLTVASKRNEQIEVRCWDIDYVQKTGKWSLQSLTLEDNLDSIPNINSLKSIPHGTLVVWQNLDRLESGTIDFSKSMGKQIDSVRDHLSLVFHRYLSGDKDLNRISISINDNPVIPFDPFLLKKSDKTMQEETYIVQGEKIKVQPYILPHISKMTQSELKSIGGNDGLRKMQGFYVYRNKRLIVWGTWFRMMPKAELSKLARIRVDIPNTLDNLWTLDIKKSSAIPPEEVKTNLLNVINNICEKSKLKYTKRGKIETNDNSIHIWNRMKARDGGFYYEINRDHPIVQLIKEQLGTNNSSLDTLLLQIERSIPINQIYVDLNNDDQVINEQQPQGKEIEEALRGMLNHIETKDKKMNFIIRMELVPPYSLYKDIIANIKKEILNEQ